MSDKPGAYDFYDEDLHGSVSPHQHRPLCDCFVELLELLHAVLPECNDQLEAIKAKALNYKAPPPKSRSDI